MELIDIAKEKVKLIDYVQGSKKKSGKWVSVKPCPCCGRDHFKIDTIKNTYSTFGACDGGGGSIVDYLVNVEHFEISKALSYTLELAGLKEANKKTASEIKKLKEERLKQLRLKQLKVKRFNLLYHKLTNLYKNVVKIPLDERNALIVWLVNFLDHYTNLMICNPENYYLSENFKANFENEFKNFCKWEVDFENTILGGKSL